jgi:hypothetical protein
MRCTRWILAVVLAANPLVAAVAAGGDGLTARTDNLPWERWQGRISLGTQTPLWRSDLGASESYALPLRSLTLMGDYYFSRSLAGSTVAGGFRATSGVILGPRSQLWTGQPGPAPQGINVGVDRRVFGQAAVSLANESTPDTATLPYLGLGYTGLSLRGRWSFSADLGLVAMSPGNAVKLGRVFGGAQSLDELVRDMRLAPLLQLGVSYSF